MAMIGNPETATSSGSGRSVQRLVQFSDGVFTVALTLLVINIAVPTLPNGSTETALAEALSDHKDRLCRSDLVEEHHEVIATRAGGGVAGRRLGEPLD